MTRRGSFALLLALVVSTLSVQAWGTAAAAPRLREYRGTTSAGWTIRITTAVTDAGIRVSELRFGWSLTCEDTTEVQLGMVIGFYRGPLQQPARIDLDLISSFDALHLHGRLGVHQGSGTLSFLIPALTAGEQAQTCGTGDLTWQVHRVTGSAPRPSAPRGAVVVTTHPMPGVVQTVVNGGAAPPATGPPRHYRGRTSQAMPMRVVMVKTANGPALRDLDLNLTMTCDDGSTIGLGAGYGFFPGLPMTRARLDLDQADYTEALHVQGDLTIHFGTGTLSLIWPVLTEDEQPQLCAARDLAWTAWRTDPGKRPG